ncbi:MAG: ABC transporter permease [Clostridia bacterium]|nr:ABC transporter permease [Clostridia bacterium]
MKINKVLITDAIRTIQHSQARFLSIIAIVALGVSFFAGTNATSPDMMDTVQKYLTDTNSMDIQIISTAGITDDDIAIVSSINGIESAVGEKFVDGVVKIDGEIISDIDGSELAIRAISLDMNQVFAHVSGTDDPRYMNRPQLIEGSWPTAQNQCLVDASMLSTPEQFKIGATLSIRGDGTDITASLSNTEYTIVGIIRSPLFISYERGSSTVGTGKLGAFCYVPSDNFLQDYYSSMSVKIQGTDGLDPYSKEYNALVKRYTDYLSQISTEVLSRRTDALKAEYTVKVADAEIEYATTKADVELQLENGKAQVEMILDMAQNGDKNLVEFKKQYNEKATEAAQTIDASKLEHSTQYAAWEQKRNEYNSAMQKVQQHSNADVELETAKTEYNVASMQVNTLLTTVTYFEDLIATTRSAMDQFNASQDDTVGDIINRFEQSGLVGAEVDEIMSSINSLTAVGTAEEMMAYMEPQLQSFEIKLANAKADLAAAKTELASKKAELDKAEQLVAELKQLEQDLQVAKVQLDEAEKQLTAAEHDIQFGELEVIAQLSDMKNQISAYETNYLLAKEKAKTIEAEYEAAKNDATDKLEQAKNQLEQAKQFLLSLDNSKWYVNNREDALLGFEAYGQMSDRIAAISLIFPWFFFIVAALVCLNTMTRMIEEERTRIGTFKALGFTDEEIMAKYIIFALSASAIGSVAGSFLGFVLFPTMFSMAFGILFAVPNILISYRLLFGILGIVVSIAVTVFATWYTCYKSLEVVPASLMRSKAPKNGKKVFLENYPAIWSKLSFTWKVTFRNVFRNIKRFFMATMGVAGCTALLVAAFGLDSSIDRTLQYQFTNEDSIWQYDMQIVLNGGYDTTVTECDALSLVKENPAISSSMLSYMTVYNTTSDKSNKLVETYLLVPENGAELNNYINLRSRVGKKTYQLGQTGAIITEKLADTLKLDVGDVIRVMVNDDRGVNIPVAAITENYALHYIYITKDVYSAVFGSNPAYNYITANLADPNLNGQAKNELAKNLMSEYEISAVAYTSEIETSFQNTLDSISIVVLILIVCSGLLAFIVLYNLSIINITERLREIATIKVLGFDDLEVSAYIFRENVILTIIGIIEGLFCGIVIHQVVISMAEVDIIMYGRGLPLTCFLYSAALAFVFSMTVNLLLHRKLQKVDMVESLKSIE